MAHDNRFVTYQAMIRAIDIGFEQIFKAAQEQTDRETIIVFTSDNGAATRFRPWGISEKFTSKFHTNTGCNYPLKGQKSSINEAGSPFSNFYKQFSSFVFKNLDIKF